MLLIKDLKLNLSIFYLNENTCQIKAKYEPKMKITNNRQESLNRKEDKVYRRCECLLKPYLNPGVL